MPLDFANIRLKYGIEIEFQTINGHEKDDDAGDDIRFCWQNHFKESFPMPDTISYGHDGSVSGGELRSAYPMGKQATLDAFGALFSQHTLGIDEECSCHIHVSYPGMQGEYSSRFQARCMDYIESNLARVPDRVLERWQNESWMNQYYRYDLMSGKYAFIAFRRDVSGQKDGSTATHGTTWEFRCWGNVNSTKDLKVCIDLTREAMMYAENSIFNNIQTPSASQFHEKVEREIERRVPLRRAG